MANALMVKVEASGYMGPPTFRVVPSGNVISQRAKGYILLIDERDVRRADLDEVREADEARGRINRPRWHR